MSTDAVRLVRFALAFTVLHAVLAMSTLLVSFSKGMERFDNPSLPATYAERLSGYWADLLFQPMMSMWDAAAIQEASPAVEWLAFFLNSSIWGFILGVIGTWLTILCNRRAKRAAQIKC